MYVCIVCVTVCEQAAIISMCLREREREVEIINVQADYFHSNHTGCTNRSHGKATDTVPELWCAGCLSSWIQSRWRQKNGAGKERERERERESADKKLHFIHLVAFQAIITLLVCHSPIVFFSIAPCTFYYFDFVCT
jgi:hypothetical protein